MAKDEERSRARTELFKAVAEIIVRLHALHLGGRRSLGDIKWESPSGRDGLRNGVDDTVWTCNPFFDVKAIAKQVQATVKIVDFAVRVRFEWPLKPVALFTQPEAIGQVRLIREADPVEKANRS